MNPELLLWSRILALKSVEIPTYEDIFDSICRNYSEKFHTPLHQVYDLDPQFVIKHFYSSRLADLYFSHEEQDKQQYEKMREQILTKPGQKPTENALEDEDWVKKLEEELREASTQVAKKIENTPLPEVPNLTEMPEEFKIPDSGSMGS